MRGRLSRQATGCDPENPRPSPPQRPKAPSHPGAAAAADSGRRESRSCSPLDSIYGLANHFQTSRLLESGPGRHPPPGTSRTAGPLEVHESASRIFAPRAGRLLCAGAPATSVRPRTAPGCHGVLDPRFVSHSTRRTCTANPDARDRSESKSLGGCSSGKRGNIERRGLAGTRDVGGVWQWQQTSAGYGRCPYRHRDADGLDDGCARDR
jgi:hypothetical protein